MAKNLTEEQKKLVSDNYDMIDRFMRRNCLTYSSSEDWHGILSYCLCMASKKYDSSMGASFRTFAYWYLRSGYHHEISRIVNKRKLFKEYSIDRKNSVYDAVGDCDNSSSYLETIGADNSGVSIEEIMDIRKAYAESLKNFKPFQVERIKEYYNSGKTLEEVGKKYGVTRQEMSRMTLRFVRILRKKWGTDS